MLFKSLMLWLTFLMTMHSIAFAEEVSEPKSHPAYELEPIYVEGTAGDILLDDPVVTSHSGKTRLNSGSGAIQNSIQNQVALPVTEYGTAGGLAQMRGFGVSSEDIDVQAMGISLNPPQGGGFDLSIFPQYLWSGYRFQYGPSLNALNQSASSGTLSLVPWTVQALNEPENPASLGGSWGVSGRAVEFYSSLGVNQVSAAVKSGKDVALVAGYSSNKVVGPSGGMSTRWRRGQYTGSFHLLVTDLNAETPGSLFYPTPEAKLRSTRAIPVLQNDYRISRNGIFKSSLFYDGGRLNYNNPSDGSWSHDVIQQWGAENALLIEKWKVGVSARQVYYKTNSSFTDFEAPLQSIGNLQLGRSIDVGNLDIEPTLQGIWVTGYGLLPEGTVGVRREWNQGKEALFSRISFSRKIPSLWDRYTVNPEFIGNPNLQTEDDWTGQFGGEMRGLRADGSLQAFTQWKKNARVRVGNTVNNLDDAAVFGVTGTGRMDFTSFLESSGSLTVSRSRIFATSQSFPYIPTALAVAGLTVHDSKEFRKWEGSAFGRLSSSRVTNGVTGATLPGYFVMDLGAQLRLSKELSLGGRIENALDHTYEIMPGYPLGRSYSVMLAGEI